MNEDRKSFFLIVSLLDPRTKSLSFCDDKHFPTSWKREGHGFLAMEFKSFYSEIQDTQVDLLHQDASVRQPSDLSDLLGGSTCMDVDVDSVEAELNVGTHSKCTLRSPSKRGHVSAPSLLAAGSEGDSSSVTGVKGVELPNT